MNYTYLASQYCNPDTNAVDIFSDLIDGQLNYICYHVTTNGKYPFIQVMLEMSNQNAFILPSVKINEDFTNINIANMILRKIKAEFKRLKCNSEKITINEYKGIFIPSFRKSDQNVYALIDVSSTDISCLHLSKLSTTWFALPTEIININSVCNIPVSKSVCDLFTYMMPELGVLLNNESPYLLPDVVYTSSDDIKEAEFFSLFGPSKLGKYFHFCTSLSNFENKTDTINRYALFIENPIQKGEVETELETDIYDQSELCILDSCKVLVTEYESFTPLTYHTNII
jgi:hypothetical protein